MYEVFGGAPLVGTLGDWWKQIGGWTSGWESQDFQGQVLKGFVRHVKNFKYLYGKEYIATNLKVEWGDQIYM